MPRGTVLAKAKWKPYKNENATLQESFARSEVNCRKTAAAGIELLLIPSLPAPIKLKYSGNSSIGRRAA